MSDQQVLPGKVRKARPPEIVAARVAIASGKAHVEVRPVGVQPLNPGFFKLQALRTGQAAKRKTAVRQSLQGK